MINSIGSNLNYIQNIPRNANVVSHSTNPILQKNSCHSINYQQNFQANNIVNTTLSPSDKEKYLFLVDYLKDVPVSPKAYGLTCSKQLDCLLRNGKLLSKSVHDNSTTLDNIYDIATTKRAYDLSSKVIISNLLDNLVNPRIVTQRFGDIPQADKAQIVEKSNNPDIKKDPSIIDITASGVCPAASMEADYSEKFPADMARLVSGISSEQKSSILYDDLKSICPNLLDAAGILKMFKADVQGFSFDKKLAIRLAPDENTFVRAKNQEKNYDAGERNVVDVLVQGTLMQAGSQNTYDSLTETRGGEFNSNPKGLIEIEKTFVETLLKNEEITSLVYQKVDENQNLIGYNCDFDKIQKHITNAIDNGDNVIIGYVLTNEMAGITQDGNYNPKTDGDKNKIINGHEITIVGYKTDKEGKVTFICIDTDDDNDNYVEYNADWLLPKIHHAGYRANLVKDDEQEILNNSMVA